MAERAAFPEKVINQVQPGQEFEKGNKPEWFCPYHGKGDHAAKFCPVINKLEKLGWRHPSKVRRIQEETGGENTTNKVNSNSHIGPQ